MSTATGFGLEWVGRWSYEVRVKIVEIAYRYGGSESAARARPADAEAARDAMVRSERIAALLARGAG